MCDGIVCVRFHERSFVVKTDFNIFGVGIIQVSSLVFLLFLLWVFVKSSRNLTNDWLATEKVEKEQEIRSSCEMVYHYNEKKEKEKVCYGHCRRLV